MSKFRRESSPFRRRSGSRLEWWGIPIRGVRRVHRVGWPGGGIDRRIERDRPVVGQREKGTEGTQRLAWRTTIREPNGHRDASFRVRVFLFLSLSLSLSLFLSLPFPFSLVLLLPAPPSRIRFRGPWSFLANSSTAVGTTRGNVRICIIILTIISKMFDRKSYLFCYFFFLFFSFEKLVKSFGSIEGRLDRRIR